MCTVFYNSQSDTHMLPNVILVLSGRSDSYYTNLLKKKKKTGAQSYTIVLKTDPGHEFKIL